MQPTDHLRRLAARATEMRVTSHGFWLKVRAGPGNKLSWPVTKQRHLIRGAAARPPAYRSCGWVELPCSGLVSVERCWAQVQLRRLRLPSDGGSGTPGEARAAVCRWPRDRADKQHGLWGAGLQKEEKEGGRPGGCRMVTDITGYESPGPELDGPGVSGAKEIRREGVLVAAVRSASFLSVQVSCLRYT